jgi:hypothetical protein
MISLLKLVLLFSLVGMIYPFKPFHKRKNAILTLIGTFVLIVILMPETENKGSEKINIADTPKVTVTTNAKIAHDLNKASEASKSIKAEPQLPGPAPDWAVKAVIRLVDSGAWERAAAQYRRFKAEGYDTNNIVSEVEPRVLEAVKSLPATRYQDNLEGYEFLALLRPNIEHYQSKVGHYRSKLNEEREHAVTNLARSEDRMEGVTWYKHPNQPKYLNSRSTTYLLHRAKW